MSDTWELSEDEISGQRRTARPRRPRKERESPDMAAFLGRMMRAMVVRAAEGDLEALTALRQTRDDVDQAIKDAAKALHEDPLRPGYGYSWTVIGNELGISRQAARQQFS